MYRLLYRLLVVDGVEPNFGAQGSVRRLLGAADKSVMRILTVD